MGRRPPAVFVTSRARTMDKWPTGVYRAFSGILYVENPPKFHFWQPSWLWRLAHYLNANDIE
jgi:hypothetical protein